MLKRCKQVIICFFVVLGALVPMATDLLVSQASSMSQFVMFNTETLKYHNPNCRWAIRCTAHCISIVLAEAVSRGGVPCKVCGGK